MTLRQEFKLPRGVTAKVQSGTIEFDAAQQGFILAHCTDGSIAVYRHTGERVLHLTDPNGFGAPTMAIHPGDGKLWLKVFKRDGQTMIRHEVPGWIAFDIWKSG